MAAESNRGVVYTLKVVEDPEAARIMKRFGAKLGKLDADRVDSTSKLYQQSAVKQTDMVREQLRKQNQAVRDAATTQDATVTKSAEVQKKAREKQTRDFGAELKKQQQVIESTKARIASATSQMSGGLSAAAAGVTSLGQGWAYLGISSKESSEEMIKALLKVQGVVQLARGGIDIYRGITESVRAYRVMLEAATTAQVALNTAQAASVGLGAAGAAAGATGAVAGATGAAGVASIPLAARAIGGLTAAVKGAAAALTSVPGIVLGIAAGAATLLDVGGIRSKRAAAGAASGRYDPETLKSRLLLGTNYEENIGLQRGTEIRKGYEESKARVSRAESAQETQRQHAPILAAQAAALVKAELAKTPLTQKQLQARMSGLQQQQAEVNLGERTGSLSHRLIIERQIAALREGVINVANKDVTAAEKRRDIARQESAERLRTADELIARARREQDIQKQIVDQQRGVLQSAAERFALMNPLEQRRAIMLKQRAERGEEMSAQEYQTLAGVGTAKARDLGGKGLRGIAEERGFSKHFGEQERQDIAGATQERQRLSLEIKDQRQFQIDVTRNDAEFAKRIGKELAEHVKRRDKWIKEAVTEEFERRLRDRDRGLGEARSAGVVLVR